jgi:hypothetical protein
MYTFLAKCTIYIIVTAGSHVSLPHDILPLCKHKKITTKVKHCLFQKKESKMTVIPLVLSLPTLQIHPSNHRRKTEHNLCHFPGICQFQMPKIPVDPDKDKQIAQDIGHSWLVNSVFRGFLGSFSTCCTRAGGSHAEQLTHETRGEPSLCSCMGSY